MQQGLVRASLNKEQLLAAAARRTRQANVERARGARRRRAQTERATVRRSESFEEGRAASLDRAGANREGVLGGRAASARGHASCVRAVRRQHRASVAELRSWAEEERTAPYNFAPVTARGRVRYSHVRSPRAASAGRERDAAGRRRSLGERTLDRQRQAVELLKQRRAGAVGDQVRTCTTPQPAAAPAAITV